MVNRIINHIILFYFNIFDWFFSILLSFSLTSFKTEKIIQRNLRRSKKNYISVPKTTEFPIVYHSAVYREILRKTIKRLNSNLQMICIYCADTGQRIHELHHTHYRKQKKRLLAIPFTNHVCRLVKEEKHFPEYTCVITQKQGSYKKYCMYKDSLPSYGSTMDFYHPFWPSLDTKKKKSKKEKMCPNKAPTSLPNCRFIDQSPELANQRTEPRHMGIDTILGRREKSEVLLSLYKRMPKKKCWLRSKDGPLRL